MLINKKENLNFVQKNSTILQSLAPVYSTAYERTILSFPVLETVTISLGKPDQDITLRNALGYMESVSKAGIDHPSIRLAEPDDRYHSNLAFLRYWSVQTRSRLSGIEFEVMRQNPVINHIFVFLHEMGHAYDYIYNYLNTQPSAEEAANVFLKQRKQELYTLPYPGVHLPALLHAHQTGQLGNIFEKHRGYFKKRGILSLNDLLKRQEEEYIQLPMEAYGNNFATQLMRNNWEEFGFDKIAKRTQTKLKG